MNARIAVAATITTLVLAGSGCGGDDSGNELRVGACTNADPTEALSFDVKAVDCDSDGAKSRVVREVGASDECDVASVSDSANDKVFCTEPHPPGSAPIKPAVGVCTTAEPIRLVNCNDREAKSKIVRRASTEQDCKQGSVRGQDGEVFCIAPN